MERKKTTRILTWNIHGSYLYYLSQCHLDFYIPYDDLRSDRYIGRGQTYPYGSNVHEVHVNDIKHLEFDLIIFQCDENYLNDQHYLFSDEQKELPRIYIEHDPPWHHPTDEVHPVKDPAVTLVHVTHFNKLMWRSLLPDIRVITHGVITPEHRYKGHLKKGIVMVNNMPSRGRMVGFDLFEQVCKKVPLDLIGMGAESYGIGEVLHPQMPEFIAQYRFYFSPIQYTSLGLATCEAMMMGIPVVGLATTELSTVIENGRNGFIHTDIDYLIDRMKLLMQVPSIAMEISQQAMETAKELFSIERFVREWEELIQEKIKNITYHGKENSIYQ